MSSTISHTIKGRTKANDIFITPKDLSKQHIEMIDGRDGELWLDPCRFNEEGSYYSQFPTNKDWCEINEDKDFMNYEGSPDIICCNPPYSILDIWIKKCIELNPRVISMLIGLGNLTTRRMEWLNDAGYGLNKMKMTKVYKWYGMSVMVVFSKGEKQVVEYDRKVWR